MCWMLFLGGGLVWDEVGVDWVCVVVILFYLFVKMNGFYVFMCWLFGIVLCGLLGDWCFGLFMYFYVFWLCSFVVFLNR